MPSMSLFRRRDPMWGIDGAAARRRRRWRQFVAFIAFILSLSALGGAVAAWALALGFDRLLGLPLTLFVR